MNVEMPKPVIPASGSAKVEYADCDLHPRTSSGRDLYPFLTTQWRRFLEEMGTVSHAAFPTQTLYTRSQPGSVRRDAWTPDGGAPGTSVAFMGQQHLDVHNIRFGCLMVTPVEAGHRNPDYAAAYCTALNDWLKAEWMQKDRRLRGSIAWPANNMEAAVAEVERRATDPDFVQIEMLSRSGSLYGDRKYWPLFEAAAAADLPLAFHPSYSDLDFPLTSSGWPSYYIEEMMHHTQVYQAHLTSIILSGVLDRFPRLRLAVIEGGMAWLPALAWRMDHHFERFRSEVPHLKRRPSDYIRDHIWITSHPMEEPDNHEHLKDTFDWIGWDRVMFASDYPHWDNDDPSFVMPFRTTADQRKSFFIDNALRFYKVDYNDLP